MGFVLPESFIFSVIVDSSPVNWESWFLKKAFTWLWNGLSAMYSKYTTVCMTNFRQKHIREYRRDPVIASPLYIHSIHKDCQLPHTRLILVLSDAAVPEDILQHTRLARSLEQGLIFKNTSVSGRIMTRNPRFNLHFKFNLWNTFFWFSNFNMEMFLNINVFGFSGNSLIRWCSVLSIPYAKYHDCQQWYFGYWFTLWLRTRVKETWLALS